MQYIDGRREFIETWGQLAIEWGENKTIGQVHALLLISHEPVCADDIMNELDISRGNVNGTLHHLMDMEIVYKQLKSGDRKTYYTAEKDMWKVMRAVVIKRKEKELDPMITTLERLNKVSPQCDKSEEFCRTIKEIKDFSYKADRILESFTGSEVNWLMKSMNRVMLR